MPLCPLSDLDSKPWIVLTTLGNQDFDGGMKTRSFLALCVALIPSTLAFAAGADEKAVRDADEAWSNAALAGDVDKTVSYYADDAVVLPPNLATVTGKENIHNLGKASSTV